MFGSALIFPCNHCIRTSGNVHGACLLAEHLAVVIASPVRTDMVLCGGVGDAVASIACIYVPRSIGIHQQVLPERVVSMTFDIELPRSAYRLGTLLVLSPAVVREALSLPQIVRQVNSITREQERAACLIELLESVQSEHIDRLWSVGFKGSLALQSAVLVEVPPDNLAVAHVHASGSEVGER